jgi:hypothetical protein
MEAKFMTHKHSIFFWVITVIVLSILCYGAYHEKERRNRQWDAYCYHGCVNNLLGIGAAMQEIYLKRQKEGMKSITVGKRSNNNEYWWIDAMRENKMSDLGPESEGFLYCPYDTDRAHPSSYMSNPNLNLTDISKLKDAGRTILIMERVPFHKGEYHCILADFSICMIDKNDIGKFKRW